MRPQSEKPPKGLEIVHRDGQLHLSYRHHRGTGLFLFLAGLFWTALLLPCYRVLSAGGGFGPREFVAFLPFLSLAVGFGYVGLAKMLNFNEITLTRDKLTVGHHPVPWFGALEMPTAEVAGIRVGQDLKPRDARHRVTLRLLVDKPNGQRVALLRAIADPVAARLMQQQAQTYLEEIRSSEGSSRA